MRVLTALTYYRPHTSGLTIYAERLARAMVRRGHDVTILTMQYLPDLPREEVVDGVRIIRVPVVARVSKGVIAPTFGFHATAQVFKHDAVLLHLPQFDAAGVALRARLFGKPCILTFHCSLQLTESPFNRLVNKVVHAVDEVAARAAGKVVTYTTDYAEASTFLTRHKSKLAIIPPPVELPLVPESEKVSFRQRWNPSKRFPVIGMAARLAAEKGVEVLLDALPKVRARFPDAMVLFAGQYENVLSEQGYAELVMPRIRSLQAEGAWQFTGVLSPFEMACFYPALDVLVVPSLNSTESFGLVQIEAMMNGVPVVASNLPGVRQPVLTTGMGKIAQIGDAASLAEALIGVIEARDTYRTDSESIRRRFSPEETARAYENLFSELGCRER
jgi:glycosyltransferase involved in cell wall biosynthesis